jgi:hypothetical protein
VHKFDEVNQRLERIEGAIAGLTAFLSEFVGRGSASSGGCGGCGKNEGYDDGRAREKVFDGDVGLRQQEMEKGLLPIPPQQQQQQRQFITDEKGTLQYLGSSSILSITSEAQNLAEEKLIQANIIPLRPLEHGHLGGDDMDGINGMDGVNRSSEKLASAMPSYGHTIFRKNAAMVKSCIPDK